MTTYVHRLMFGCMCLAAALGWTLAALFALDRSHALAALEHTQSRYERCVLTTISASVQIDRAQRAWDAFNINYGHVLVPPMEVEE